MQQQKHRFDDLIYAGRPLPTQNNIAGHVRLIESNLREEDVLLS